MREKRSSCPWRLSTYGSHELWGSPRSFDNPWWKQILCSKEISLSLENVKKEKKESYLDGFTGSIKRCVFIAVFYGLCNSSIFLWEGSYKNQKAEAKWLVQWLSNFINCSHCKKSFFFFTSDLGTQKTCVYIIYICKYIYPITFLSFILHF